MTPEEKAAMEAYQQEGVDLPELKEEQPATPDAPEAPKEEAPKEEQPKEEPQAPLQEPEKLERKRSIYDEYKEKKAELKSERELREQAERERDEFKKLLDARNDARTPEERQEAQDDIDAFAKEINADPEALRRMRDLFLKDAKPQVDESLMRDLEEFKTWKAQNSQALEKQAFEEEFQASIPALKELLPTASDEEMRAVKSELDRLSHTKEFHDKPLDYIAFKHRSELSALISPKKRGIETNSKPDVQEESFDFDPNADLSKMSYKQREKWESEYQKIMAAPGLMTNSDGKRVML